MECHLKLPHPGLRNRPSVLVPLREVEPEYFNRNTYETIDEMIAALDKQGEEYVSITRFGSFGRRESSKRAV